MQSYQNQNIPILFPLLTRLYVRGLLSERNGGLNSPSVITIDAGNCSDIYQCISFARQYGLDIRNVLQRIIVSRSFTTYQLAHLIINELPNIIQKFNQACLQF